MKHGVKEERRGGGVLSHLVYLSFRPSLSRPFEPPGSVKNNSKHSVLHWDTLCRITCSARDALSKASSLAIFSASRDLVILNIWRFKSSIVSTGIEDEEKRKYGSVGKQREVERLRKEEIRTSDGAHQWY